MGREMSKAGRPIADFNIDEAAEVLTRLHERLRTSGSSGIKLTPEESTAIGAAASFLAIKGKGPRPGPSSKPILT